MADPSPARPRRWLRRGVALVLLLAIAVAVGRAALPGVAHSWLVETLAQQLNVDLVVDEVDVDLRGEHATLTGLRAELDGELLASATSAEVDLDIVGLLRGRGGTITIELHDLRGEIHVVEGGALNLTRIAPRQDAGPADPNEGDTDARIALDIRARGAAIRLRDAVTAPGLPLDLLVEHASITATQVVVVGSDAGAPLMDLRILGAIRQDAGPALLAAGLWEGDGEGGRYVELHAALTAFDVRTIPQYVTPRAGSVLGGDILHVAATAVAHGGTIEQGLVEVEVEDSSADLELRFGGPTSAPVFDMDSPVLEAFRLSYLRVVDSGSSALSFGKGIGMSLWDRSSGLVTDTAGGVGAAVSELSIKRLGQGIRKGLAGLFGGSEEDDREAHAERWADYARRQLAFRELYLRRRIAVAKEREPDRVGAFEEMLVSRSWRHDLEALIPDDGRSPAADD